MVLGATPTACWIFSKAETASALAARFEMLQICWARQTREANAKAMHRPASFPVPPLTRQGCTIQCGYSVGFTCLVPVIGLVAMNYHSLTITILALAMFPVAAAKSDCTATYGCVRAGVPNLRSLDHNHRRALLPPKTSATSMTNI